VSLRASELKVGDEREAVLVDDLTRTQIVQYAGASGDFNPLHSDERFTTEIAGYPSVFGHGMLTMGMTGRLLTDWVGDGRLTRYGVQFRNQVWPGDTLTGKAVVDGVRAEDGVDLVDLSVTVVNQRGETVLTGSASARIDP
jgi:acyl dehydratase